MKTIQSTQHKEIVGSVNDVPYIVSFDADGFADVDDAVADQLTSGRYGVVLIDEDGAEVPNTPAAESTIAPEEVVKPEVIDAATKPETTPHANRRRRTLDEGAAAE